MTDFRILSDKEEKRLSPSEKNEYYSHLRDYILSNIPDLYSASGIKLREIYIKIVKIILPKIIPYRFIVDGIENISEEPVIFASTHQDFYDIINSIYSCPSQMIVCNAINIRPALKIPLITNGVVFVDRNNKESRLSTKLQLSKVILNGKSINIYPEGTLNCSPNKLHLPLYKGIADIAKITGAKIVPIVQEYTYDETKLDGKSHVISAHIRFCKPISVDTNDDSIQKMKEVSESFATGRWNLMEERGTFRRKNITNELYTNYIKSRIRDWRIPGNDINLERLQIFGAQDDFYLFHHINDVAFNEKNEFRPTEYVEKLDRIVVCSGKYYNYYS